MNFIKKIFLTTIIFSIIMSLSPVFVGCPSKPIVEETSLVEETTPIKEATSEETITTKEATEETTSTEEITGEAIIEEKKEIPPEGYWEISFKTDDGIDIEGRLFGTGENGVILAHMYPADQESWKDFALLLTQKGYSVLTFNFRGYGKSGGKKEISLIYKDVFAAYDLLKDEGIEDIILIGASMGGTAVLKVAAQRDVAGVISMSGPLNWKEMGLSAEEEMELIEEPKLFLASEGDGSAVNSAKLMHELSIEPKQLEIYSGSEHGTNMFLGAEGEKVKQDIISFIEKNLPVK